MRPKELYEMNKEELEQELQTTLKEVVEAEKHYYELKARSREISFLIEQTQNRQPWQN